MGTRSTIALEYADGTVEQVYCHWDGYLDHNGKILQDNYSDPFELQRLINRGDMSSLSKTIDGCVFYADRSEELNISKYKDIADYFNNVQQEEYDYILRCIAGRAVWFVRHYDTDGGWTELVNELEKENV
jgi:hypothetical protein